jgi:predicted RNase H-like nuclease (RuvC/YqgF family)
MNAKRWFAWVCLALMLVAEILLLRANHDRDAALTDLRDAQRQLRDAQTELEALKNSSAGVQAAEIASLHKQNDALTAKASALQKNVERLQAESQQTAQHLTTARTALEVQQEHLQQLQAEQQRAAQLANANACINNLRQLDAAKQQWALDKNKAATDVPTSQDLLPYLKDGIFPVCPDGGSYSLNAAGELPACSIQGHVLPPQ